VANGRSNIPYTKKRVYWKSKELQACDMSAYDIQTYYISYKQTHAEIYGYLKFATKRKGAAVEQKDADFKSNTTRIQKQKEKFEYGMDWLWESFWQGAT